MLKAAEIIVNENIAEPILLGNEKIIHSIIEENNIINIVVYVNSFFNLGLISLISVCTKTLT
jgi:phosphotransacetylase